jgi:CheY-like chemotaxis protein
MDDTTRRRCFEPFFSTKGERGTGMGLAMVYGMVKRHGADIEIDSESGAGTTIRMRFAAATSATPSQTAAEAQPLPPQHILIVDDDPIVARTLYDILQVDGHRARIADGGQAGIDEFRAAAATQTPYSIVITDLGMPYVDGRAVAAAIKLASPRTHVLMLTGWGQRLQQEQSIPPHVDRLMGKPATLHDLRRTLHELIADAEPAPAPTEQVAGKSERESRR